MTRNHPHTTPPRPQELNGRSLSKVASYFRRNVLFIRKGPRLIFPCIFHFRIELYPSGIGEPSCPVSFPSLPHKTNFHHGRNWIFFHIKKCLWETRKHPALFVTLKRLTFQLNLADPLASVLRRLLSYDALACLYLLTFTNTINSFRF